ncbi:inositol monophosphatase family protein [Streptomyces tsukubensis]|uniref:inositol monophosphatase family protein n=1 Tax=Streptomyces tsukubensis TaxID=83656 RepID=UPI00344C0EF4
MSGPGGRETAVLNTVLDLCRDAVERFRKAPTPARSKPSPLSPGRCEPVTDLDLGLQDLLTTAVNRLWPGIPVVAEEDRDTGAALAVPDDCVLIDPLDGTVPFLGGSADFAIALCLVRAGAPALGVVDLPAHGVRLTARPGVLDVTGNITRLPLHPPHTLLTSPRRTTDTARMLDGSRWEAAPVPTASVKLAFVALGRAPAACGAPAAPWDFPAAALAVAAAGGTVRYRPGRDLARARPRLVTGWLATNPTTDPAELTALLAPPGPRQKEGTRVCDRPL